MNGLYVDMVAIVLVGFFIFTAPLWLPIWFACFLIDKWWSRRKKKNV